VTKSGTDHFHGSIFGFLSNDNLNANSWANDLHRVPKAGYTQSIFGGTFGGPLLKGKLFFFVDYEAFRYHSSGQSVYSVAPAAFRTGDLSLLKSGLGIQLYEHADGHGVPKQSGTCHQSGGTVPLQSPFRLSAAQSAKPDRSTEYLREFRRSAGRVLAQ
jgi:hypothetical protein